MKFFVSAMEEDRNGFIAREIEADDFEQALGIVGAQAHLEFEGRRYRVTSVTEVPELGFQFHGSAIVAAGVVHGEAVLRRDGRARS